MFPIFTKIGVASFVKRIYRTLAYKAHYSDFSDSEVSIQLLHVMAS